MSPLLAISGIVFTLAIGIVVAVGIYNAIVPIQPSLEQRILELIKIAQPHIVDVYKPTRKEVDKFHEEWNKFPFSSSQLTEEQKAAYRELSKLQDTTEGCLFLIRWTGN